MNPLLLPNDRDGLDTRAVRLVVQGDVELSASQRAEVEHRFFRHKMALRASLAQYLVQDGHLSDGTRLRMVSNSGLHTILVWPTRTVNLRELPWGVFCIPADTSNQYGWAPPAVDGENGTPATGGSGSRDKAGTLTPLTQDPTDEDHAKPGKLQRFQSTVLPLYVGGITTSTILNAEFFADDEPNNTSVQNWEHREWVAPDMGSVVTTYTGNVVVNGELMGRPSYDKLLWACIYTADGTGDFAGPTLLAVSIDFNRIKVARKSIGAGGSWSDLASVLLLDLDADAISNGSNGFPTLIDWIWKVACNESGTVVSVWVQNPDADTKAAASDYDFFVGVVDIDMNTGAVTSTPAEGEVVNHLISGSPNNFTETVTFGGSRQISFDYEGDTKVFTELAFSGTAQVVYARSVDSFSYSYTYSLTDTREIRLVRGDVNRLLSFVQVDAMSHEESGSYTEAHPGSGYGPGTTNFSRNIDTTLQTAELIYFGGRGNIHAALTMAQRSQSDTESGGAHVSEVILVEDPGGTDYIVGGPFWRHVTTTTSTDNGWEQHTYFAALPDASEIDLGQNTRPGATSTADGSVSANQWVDLGDTSDSSETNAGGDQRWGSATSDDADLLVPTPDGAFFSLTPRVLTSNGPRCGHPRYHNVNASDLSSMNVRCVKDFILLSVPKLLPLIDDVDLFQVDPATFVTYCTDADTLDAFNVDATLGVLKGIRLK
jgi:hypothetical protein